MAVNFNPNIGSVNSINSVGGSGAAERLTQAKQVETKGDFARSVLNSLQEVNAQQGQADASITDLLSGRNQDINSVVASVAKADVSFKLLVGVRNKLVEAYRETMRMQI